MATEANQKNKPPPLQTIVASFCGFGVFGLLLGLIPAFSLPFLLVGLLAATLATAAILLGSMTHSWIARMSAAAVFTLQLLALALRALHQSVAPMFLVSIVVGYTVAWLIPPAWPSLSETLWREQTAPKTRIGRFVLAGFVALAPSLGALGAGMGMYGSRFGQTSTALLVVGVLFSVLAIGLAQAFCHQLWPDRPWATDTDGG